MCASLGSSRSTGLRIKDKPAEGFELGQMGSESGSSSIVVVKVPPMDHPPLPGKGKGKISEIRYSNGSEYLRAVVRYSDVMGPMRVEPSYAETFVACYRPPVGVRV